jgi:hypothetical protein
VCILHMMPQSMVSSSQGSPVALFLIPSRQTDDFFALAVHAACRAQRPSAEEVLKERDPHGLKLAADEPPNSDVWSSCHRSDLLVRGCLHHCI